jgi:hypothetical protein
MKSKPIPPLKSDYRLGFWYCYRRGDKTVFLNRKDETIKEFGDHEEAVEYATANIHLIDKPGLKNKAA